MRHRLTSAVVVAAAALGGLAVPCTAQAADSRCLNGMQASLDGSGTLRILRAADPEVPRPVVHLRDKKTGVRVATVDRFHEAPSESGPGSTDDLVSDPLKLEHLAVYAIEVGSDRDHAVCGDFDYRRLVTIADATTEGQVSLDDLRTTVSAVFSVRDPRTGTTAPLARTRIALAGLGSTQEGTTDAEGRLCAPYTFRGTERETSVRLRVQQVPPEDIPAEKTVHASAVPQKATIVLDPDSQKITARFGEVKTIKGQAFRIAADGTRTPVPEGTPMFADIIGVPVTDADGKFERQIRAVNYGARRTTWVNDSSYPWLTHLRVYTDLELYAVTKFTDVEATIDAARNVRFTGGFTIRPATRTPVNIEVQYSADGKTNWTTRKTFTAQTNSLFEQQTLPGETDGYWRLRYAAEGRFLGSHTRPVRLTRTATAFTYFNAAPEPVRKGQAFTIKGTLRHGTPAKAYAGQSVLFYFQPAGSKSPVYKGSAKTAADGTFTRAFKADTTGSWFARYLDADGRHYDAESRRDDLTVNP